MRKIKFTFSFQLHLIINIYSIALMKSKAFSNKCEMIQIFFKTERMTSKFSRYYLNLISTLNQLLLLPLQTNTFVYDTYFYFQDARYLPIHIKQTISYIHDFFFVERFYTLYISNYFLPEIKIMNFFFSKQK